MKNLDLRVSCCEYKTAYEECKKTTYHLELFQGKYYCPIHIEVVKITYSERRVNAKRLGMLVPKGL